MQAVPDQPTRSLPAPPDRQAQPARATKPDPSRPGPGRPGISRRRAWTTAAATAVAAALLGITGTGLILGRGGEPARQPDVVSAAELTAYGSTPKTAAGTAQLLDGTTLRLRVANLPAVDGYYEVWLIDPETLGMFSVGVLNRDAEATFTLPANVDLGRFRTVDVSAEHFDNNTAHSGDSLLRGTLD